MIFGVALEVLRKQSNCWDKITDCSANCNKCECHVDASDLVEAVRAVLDAFGNCSELPNTSQTKFKPGSKFLLEIGEKRIGLDEYSIVGTDLYVWGSLLEKLTPYEPSVQAKQKWIPCSEKMPEENTDILVTYVDGEETRIIPVNYGRGTWFDCIFDVALDPLKITAWQPIPESYRGDAE